jgi:hypothetical protein
MWGIRICVGRVWRTFVLIFLLLFMFCYGLTTAVICIIFYFQIRFQAISAKKQMKSVNDSKIRFTLVTILGHSDHFQAGWVFIKPFRRQKPPRTHLSRSGCIFLIPASNVSQTTFRSVGLTIFHSGVKGHPDHFWAGRAVSFSFRRRMPPRLLLVRSGKNKKA